MTHDLSLILAGGLIAFFTRWLLNVVDYRACRRANRKLRDHYVSDDAVRRVK